MSNQYTESRKLCRWNTDVLTLSRCHCSRCHCSRCHCSRCHCRDTNMQWMRNGWVLLNVWSLAKTPRRELGGISSLSGQFVNCKCFTVRTLSDYKEGRKEGFELCERRKWGCAIYLHSTLQYTLLSRIFDQFKCWYVYEC